VELLRDAPACCNVAAAVLQAPVSDREYLATLPETAPRLAAAALLVAAGRGGELLPLAGEGARHARALLRARAHSRPRAQATRRSPRRASSRWPRSAALTTCSRLT
jgi:hypothetical protein